MSYLNNYLFNIMAVIVTSSFKRDIKRRYLELDALYLPFKIERELVIREKTDKILIMLDRS